MDEYKQDKHNKMLLLSGPILTEQHTFDVRFLRDEKFPHLYSTSINGRILWTYDFRYEAEFGHAKVVLWWKWARFIPWPLNKLAYAKIKKTLQDLSHARYDKVSDI